MHLIRKMVEFVGGPKDGAVERVRTDTGEFYYTGRLQKGVHRYVFEVDKFVYDGVVQQPIGA